MLTSTRPQVAASIVIMLGVTYIWVFAPPFFVTIIFAALCILWSAWTIISVLRGTDELQSASTRYALAIASGVGIPLSIVFVLLMISTPSVQDTITNIAMVGNSGLSQAAIGFGLGVTFTMVLQCVICVIASSTWWMSKQ